MDTSDPSPFKAIALVRNIPVRALRLIYNCLKKDFFNGEKFNPDTKREFFDEKLKHLFGGTIKATEIWTVLGKGVICHRKKKEISKHAILSLIHSLLVLAASQGLDLPKDRFWTGELYVKHNPAALATNDNDFITEEPKKGIIILLQKNKTMMKNRLKMMKNRLKRESS